MSRYTKALLLWLVLICPFASAFAEYKTLDLEKLRVVVDTDWSPQIAPGYFPIRLDLTNSGEARELQLVVTGQRWFDFFRRVRTPTLFGTPQLGNLNLRQTVRLKRGDRVKLSVPVPVFADSESLQLQLWENGKRIDGFQSYTSLQSGRELGESPVLFVASGTSPLSIDEATWARPITSSRGYPAAMTGKAAPKMDFLLDPERIPSNWIAYTGLRAVALGPAEWSALNPQQKDALLAWTAGGGDLLFIDGELETLLAAPDKRPATLNPGKNRQQFYLGNIHLLSSSEISEIGLPEILHRVNEGTPYSDWALPANRAADWTWVSEQGFRLPVNGAVGVPRRTYLGLLVAFTLIIGPVNFLYLWRKRQQVLLVVTVPLIAAGFIALLTTYILFGEGFTIKGRSTTFTVLDQSVKQAATRATVSLYAGGISPSGGLAFPADVAVYPVGTDGHGTVGEMGMDLTNDQQFSSGLIRARAPTNFEEVTFRPARERLSFERTNNGFTVVNGLGGTITALKYRDGDQVYTLKEKVAAGERGTLRHDSGTGASVFIEPLQLVVSYPLKYQHVIDTQPAGSYLAVLETSPFLERGFAKVTERSSLHMVLGFVGEQP